VTLVDGDGDGAGVAHPVIRSDTRGSSPRSSPRVPDLPPASSARCAQLGQAVLRGREGGPSTWRAAPPPSAGCSSRCDVPPQALLLLGPGGSSALRLVRSAAGSVPSAPSGRRLRSEAARLLGEMAPRRRNRSRASSSFARVHRSPTSRRLLDRRTPSSPPPTARSRSR